MLAGGTGITPIYQVVQTVLRDQDDKTEMHIVYANRTEDDILLRDELDEWARTDDRLKVWYVVQESIKEGWEYSTGFITEAILREHIPDGSDGEVLALACGPPPMIQFAVQPNLEKLGYDVKESLMVF
ncbi:Inducible nitrate reductase [NADH] 1 [Linum perenne]